MARFNFAGLGAGLGQGISAGFQKTYIDPRQKMMDLQNLLQNAAKIQTKFPQAFNPNGGISPQFMGPLQLASGQFSKPVDPMQAMFSQFLSQMPGFQSNQKSPTQQSSQEAIAWFKNPENPKEEIGALDVDELIDFVKKGYERVK